MEKKITIVGLGSGNEDRLTLGVLKELRSGKAIFLRTEQHPVVEYMRKEGLCYKSFDSLYESADSFGDVYHNIVEELLTEVDSLGELIYAVPGNPLVAEQTVKILLALEKEVGIKIRVLGGESFLDTFFESLKLDPVEGFMLLNGETFGAHQLNSEINTLIAQVYSQAIASQVKLELMEYYSDDYIVYIVENLGITESERVTGLPLFELDRNPNRFHNRSSIFVPTNYEPLLIKRDLHQLLKTVKVLRGPDGCQWDRAQTHQSIRENLIEETFELVETIDQLDYDAMAEELGDVLLQVILHSLMAEEEGYFDLYDIIEELMSKLIRRHPHVFGEATASKEHEARAEWDRIKVLENIERGNKRKSVLDGVPIGLPEIYKAYKLQKKAAKVGFDWNQVSNVYDKIEEELSEVRLATDNNVAGELGDLLFAVINLARFKKIDPAAALAITNRKFIKRFKYIEEQLKKQELAIEEAGLELMDSYWEEAKKLD